MVVAWWLHGGYWVVAWWLHDGHYHYHYPLPLPLPLLLQLPLPLPLLLQLYYCHYHYRYATTIIVTSTTTTTTPSHDHTIVNVKAQNYTKMIGAGDTETPISAAEAGPSATIMRHPLTSITRGNRGTNTIIPLLFLSIVD